MSMISADLVHVTTSPMFVQQLKILLQYINFKLCILKRGDFINSAPDFGKEFSRVDLPIFCSIHNKTVNNKIFFFHIIHLLKKFHLKS